MANAPDTRFRRIPERGSTELDAAVEILDQALLCHVGFTLDDQPYVLPMACARDGERVLLHGSVASRLMNSLAGGLPCCVTVTHLDGLVLARSAFNSSMNYRSLMVFGRAVLLEGEDKARAFDVLVEHLAPGRLADLRAPTRQEINATTMLALPLETFTVKTRSGPPGDPEKDMDSPAWAGVVPYTLVAGAPEPDPQLAEGIPLPPYLAQ